MQTLAAILKKISPEGDNTVQTLCDLMPLSYAEIYEKFYDVISDDEARTLYQQAQIQKKKNRFTDAEIVTHNNPQIKNIPFLYTGQSPELRYGNDFIPDRISEYAEPGMVSSMFSPAAYLTELYREAKNLHKENSGYHLDKRRPDLKSLSLSQENLNDEISTLELSNEVLFTALKEDKDKDEQPVLKRLSEKCQSIALPYHDPFQIIKKVSELKKIFPVVNKYPVIINNEKTNKTWIKTIYCNLSPVFLDMLKEIYTNINSTQSVKLDGLIKKYITDNFSYFYHLKDVMNYFRLTNKEFSLLSDFFDMKDDANSENIEKYKKNILKLRGVVSLYKASGLPLDTIIFILKSFNCDLANETAINAIVNIKIVRDNCQLRDEDIAVLLGGNIVQDKINAEISQFDRIFNSPPLGGEKLTADNTELDLSKVDYKDDDHEKFIINCLKRALGINASLLAELSEFIYGKKQNFICNIESLSLFYRVILIARINHTPVNELVMLFRLLPDVFKSDIQTYKSSDDIYDLLYNVNYYVTWFNENKLSILMCYFLLRNSDEVVVSQGVNDVVSEIKNGLNKKDFNDTPSNVNELITKISPALSSVLDIRSVNAMESVLQWVNILKPENIDIRTLFFNICDKEKKPGKKENKTVIYIIKMSVMINMIAIDDSLLSLWIQDPACLDISFNIRNYKFSVIKMMIDANAVIKRTGEKSDLVISSLNNDKLSYKTIADVFSQNEQIVEQAFTFLDKTKIIKDYRSLSNVKAVLDLFAETGISPDDFTKLFGNNTGSKDYTYYYNLSKISESTLEQDKVTDLKGTINKLRGSALCSLFILEKLNELHHENDSVVVYKHLLIDTEISEDIKKTRIAEAIACIQLYVNNCLNNIEKEVQDSVRTRQFFRNWEEYNRRYSTWAALSMLVYYPENYIDPVIRTGKTAMMDNLQQRINQEGIKREAIDDAFRTYLTEFDQVADLNVTSAYHDTLDIKTGKTYFIGHSGGTDLNYYLRNVNNNGVIIVDKKITMPSSTWTGWKRINCGINPYNNILRPVLFNNRMYIVWLEYSELITDDKKINAKVELCFSYLRYDDTWSETNTIDLSGKMTELERIGIKSNKKMFNYYCSEDFDGNGLLFIFYKMNIGDESNDLFAFNILSDFSVKYDCYEKSITDKAKVYFDRPGLKKIINIFENSNFKVISDPSKNEYKTDNSWLGLLSFSMSATNFLLSADKSKVACYFDFDLSVDKGLFRFSDKEKNSEYSEWLRICNNKKWYDCKVDFFVAKADSRIVMDDGNVADSVVFLFNATDRVYSAFLYNSNLREKVTLKLSDVRSVKVISFENGKNTTIEELHLDAYFAGVYYNYNELIDSITSKYKKVYVYIEKIMRQVSEQIILMP